MASFASHVFGGGGGGVTRDVRALLLAMLSPMQRKFVLDPSRRKLARCSRRAGKTYGIGIYMILECLAQAHTPVLYAGLTRDSAKEAVWDILLKILADLQIPHKASLSNLQILFDNGSKITIFGCDAQNARNRLRGRKFKLICFDETGFYLALDPLVTAVLPMLADFGGTLCLTSSPGELLQGLFYEADQGKMAAKWSRYEWTIYQNPHFTVPATDPAYKLKADEELDIVLQGQYGGNRKAAGFRREWLGEWVNDDQSLVYPCSEHNLIKAIYTMPNQEHAIGLRLGAYINGLVVGRYSEYARDFQLVHSETVEDIELDGLNDVLQERMETWDAHSIVCNTGPYTKEVLNDFRRRYSLPITPVPDKDIGFYQKLFANDLKAGHIKVAPLPIRQEYAKIVKDPDGEEIEGQPNWQADAALALYRRVHQTHLRHYTPPLTEEEMHIKQLEESRYVEETPWNERYV